MLILRGRKNITQIILILLIFLFLFLFFVYPNFKKIKSLSQEIRNYYIQLEKLYQEGQLLQNVVKDLKLIEPRIDELSKSLISKNEELDFITTLEKLADDNQINQELRIGSYQETQDKTYKILPIQLAIQANFSQLINYLIQINKLDHYININYIVISRTDNNSQIMASMEANTYWEK